MVDRYCITTAGIYNTSMGEWVKAADYEALEAKLARLVEAAERADTKLRAYRGVCEGDTELITIINLLKAAIEATKGR